MIGAQRIGFDPALPMNVLIALGVIGLVAWIFYVWRRGGAPVLRLLGLAFVLLGLSQPQWVREGRQAASDVVLLVVDQSESLLLSGRLNAARAAGDAVAARLAREQGLEVRVREARGGADGTAITGVIQDALADIPRDRVGGIIAITDGQASDPPADPRRLANQGPTHVLIVGDPARGDRRLELISAPTFGIVGEHMQVTARVIDPGFTGPVSVHVSIDGQTVSNLIAPSSRPFNIDIADLHRGRNMVIIEAAQGPHEITLANNRAAFAANGVRDRLRVLLITGEPHPGARVWRNLLKSDPAVDLVHFTILRPPEKQDETPLNELALIPFPTEELFDRKLDDFDLIIFDRYRERNILQPYYFANIARHVQNGGALLISAGDAEAGYGGVSRTALGPILPSQPTGQVIERPYRPAPTQLGLRHPVVRGLPDPSHWGRWTRQIDARASQGQTVLQGADGRPLLVLNRVGKGRVAQLWSDQAWLWARGYDGGGPHGELLRRLAHWLMQEPELDEERLTLDPDPTGLTVTRSTLANSAAAVDVIAPDGVHQSVTLSQITPGVFRGHANAQTQGLYEAHSGDLRAYAAVGPLNPREASALAADPEILRPLAQATGGSVFLTGEDGRHLPDIRRVGPGERASGGDWIGIRRNAAYTVRTAEAVPLGPGWAWAFAGLALLMWGWRRETI